MPTSGGDRRRVPADREAEAVRRRDGKRRDGPTPGRAAPPGHRFERILALQRDAGNAAVRRLLAGARVPIGVYRNPFGYSGIGSTRPS